MARKDGSNPYDRTSGRRPGDRTPSCSSMFGEHRCELDEESYDPHHSTGLWRAHVAQGPEGLITWDAKGETHRLKHFVQGFVEHKKAAHPGEMN